MASRLSPRNKAVRLSLADMFLRGKQYDAAAAQIASVLEWEPTCRTSRQLLRTVYLGEAMLQTRDGNVHAAIATYERALSTLQQQGGPGEVSEDDQGARTQRAEVSFLLGGLHESIGDATTAMQWYRRAIAESSTHWRSRMALAAACHRLGVAYVAVLLWSCPCALLCTIVARGGVLLLLPLCCRRRWRWNVHTRARVIVARGVHRCDASDGGVCSLQKQQHRAAGRGHLAVRCGSGH
jgi:tetratricopeptide (TPR) repeat protein